MTRLRLACLSLLVVLLALADAKAAGGPHIVDDSEVETPGVCHLELWVTRFVPGDGYGNVGPSCTLKSVPMMEFGLVYQHFWEQAAPVHLFGPQFKYNIFPESSGVGLGVGLNTGVNLATGNLGLAAATLLVTVPVNEAVTLNLNAGWSYIRGLQAANAFFYGAQIMAKLGFDTSLMVEGFGRTNDTAGMQMGLRYTPGDGPIDFEVLVGGFLDSFNARFITFGVTFRY